MGEARVWQLGKSMAASSVLLWLAALLTTANLQQQAQQPSQQQQFNQPPPPQQFNQPPPQQQQQMNQPPPPPQQQQFNQPPPPPPQQQQMNQPPPPQQQFNQPPPPPPQQQQQFNQPPPQQQQQFNQPPPPQQQQFAPAPPPQQQQQTWSNKEQVRMAPGVPQQQQQVRMAPGVPPPQQQQVKMAPGVPPPQQQQQVRMAPGVPLPQQQQQQVRMAPGVQQQQVQLPPGVSPQQHQAMLQQQAAAAAAAAQQQRFAPGVNPQQGQQIRLPPGVSPEQHQKMLRQQAQQGQGLTPGQNPPGHAANIAPPTPPPPPMGFDSNNPLDSAPGIAMEYKVHVEAGKEDCYWQYVHKGATLYVSYQVLKGGDGSIGMAVRNPSMKVVHPYAWKATSEYEESDIPQGGYYSVCLDNQFSRFSAKLVNLYLTTFRYDEWEKFSQELQDMDVTVENFTSTLRSVDQRVQIIRQFQSMTRSGEARDFNLIQDNSAYVQNWSIAQALVVMLCTAVQVYFVKSFFKDPREGKGGGSGFKMQT